MYSPILKRLEKKTKQCFSANNSKYYAKYKNKEIPFTVYNSTQYTVFLYFLSYVAYMTDRADKVAEKIYYLNKVLNSIDIFYEIEMPSIFGVEHPLGSVMGRAKYSDYFFFYQGCTVGGSGGHYPVIGKNVLMYSNSKILGKSIIGDNVIISANTYIKDAIIPNNSIIFGQSPNIIIKQKSKDEILEITKLNW